MSMLTRAEKTGYKETSRYSDVINFCRRLTKKSDKLKLQYIGKSYEGRDIPLLIVNNNKIFDPVLAGKGNSLVILVICSIHSGEVEGKEAGLMMLRDIAENKFKLADNVTLLLLPLFNIDGNERISYMNRAFDPVHLEGDIGPDSGVGTRHTVEGFNLNRDYMKAESNEMRIMLKEVYYKWLPHLTVDCHTTNGSFHGFDLTYGTSMNYSGDSEPIEYVRTKLLPSITKSAGRKYGLKTFFYGNYKDGKSPKSGWVAYSHKPRYGSNYRGLTNRMDILLETYSYSPFGRRVYVIKKILEEILIFASDNKYAITSVVDNACRRTIEKGSHPVDKIAVSYETTPLPYKKSERIVKQDFKVTMEFDSSDCRVRYLNFKRYGVPKYFKTKFYAKFKPKLFVKRPFAYVIPARYKTIVDVLRSHSINIEKVSSSLKMNAECYTIRDVRFVDSQDYGSKQMKETIYQVSRNYKLVRANKGDYFVSLDQPLGNLVVYLLEPHSDDGLATWNLFDLKQGDLYPIVRIVWENEAPDATDRKRR